MLCSTTSRGGRCPSLDALFPQCFANFFKHLNSPDTELTNLMVFRLPSIDWSSLNSHLDKDSPHFETRLWKMKWFDQTANDQTFPSQCIQFACFASYPNDFIVPSFIAIQRISIWMSQQCGGSAGASQSIGGQQCPDHWPPQPSICESRRSMCSIVRHPPSHLWMYLVCLSTWNSRHFVNFMCGLASIQLFDFTSEVPHTFQLILTLLKYSSFI